MNNTIEAPNQGADAELLREKRALVLAANAGFVDPVANRLRQHMDERASPRLVFDVGAAALHGAERNISRVSTRHVETIGNVIADSVLVEPVDSTYDPVSDDHMAVLLESKLSEETKNPLISLLIGKGAISRGVKQELQIDIPDTAYDAFLADITEDPVDQTASSLKSLESAKSLEELKKICMDHPLMGTRELAEKYNEILGKTIKHQGVGYGDALKYYDARIKLGNDYGEEDTTLRLVLDSKLLARAQQIAYSNNFDLLSKFLAEHRLKTDPENEQYETLSKHYDHVVQICNRGLIQNWTAMLTDLTPENFIEITNKKSSE